MGCQKNCSGKIALENIRKALHKTEKSISILSLVKRVLPSGFLFEVEINV